MNKLNIDTITQGKVTIEVKDIANGVAVVIVGDIDMQDPSVLLDPLFEKIHAGCIEQGFKTVEANVKQLTFLNSSGIKAIAKWIMKLMTVPADKKYQIKILQNKDITWQTTSLQTLTFLVPSGVVIE